jgi:Asp-tRNA(Asn)/Glu-tRNA(Gln) amidotransferase A subunit family amidase
MLDPGLQEIIAAGERITRQEYFQAVEARGALGLCMQRYHERFDLLLTPTLAEPPAVLGRFAMSNPDFLDYRLGPNGLWRYTPFTPLTNATGAPAISLPVGVSSGGLPIGAMLAAPLGGDALLLRVAAQWEAATPARRAIAPRLWN